MLDINPGLIPVDDHYLCSPLHPRQSCLEAADEVLARREQSIRDALLKAEEAREGNSERLLAENTAGDGSGRQRNVPHSERRTRTWPNR